jgi:hypothetical protein
MLAMPRGIAAHISFPSRISPDAERCRAGFLAWRDHVRPEDLTGGQLDSHHIRAEILKVLPVNNAVNNP